MHKRNFFNYSDLKKEKELKDIEIENSLYKNHFASEESSKYKNENYNFNGEGFCTFNDPILFNGKENMNNNSSGRDSSSHKHSKIDKREVWRRLQDDKREEKQQREEERRKKEERLFKETCTFKPTINKNENISMEPRTFENLYEEGLSKIKNKNCVKVEDQEYDKYSFRPHINDYYKPKTEEKPLVNRVIEIMKRKQENLVKLENEAYKIEDIPFQPKINPLSKELAINLKINGKPPKPRKANSYLEKECTFHPKINDFHIETEDFGQRLEEQYYMKQNNLQKIKKEVCEAESLTFKPKINKSSRILTEQNQSRNEETKEEKIKRLYSYTNGKKQKAIEDYEKKFNQEHTFEPKLNKRPQTAQQVENKPRYSAKIFETTEEKEVKACTFQPQLNKKSQRASSTYKEKENIIEDIQLFTKKKEIEIKQIKMKKILDEVKDCTFKPNVLDYKKQKYDCNLNSDIPGVDRHLLFMDMNKKKKNEKAAIEEKVFNHGRKYNPSKHSTVTMPNPFNLT